MGETVEAILDRQERFAREEERQKRLDELYTRARRLHHDKEWQAVVDVFGQIQAIGPGYPDPEGLLMSTREELEALEQAQSVAALYDQGLRYMETEEWSRAFERFEEVQCLKPGYQDTEELLSRVRQELAPSPTVEVPDLSGQSISQATSSLADKGLTLGTRKEAPSEKVPEGRIIRQDPETGTEVAAGSSVTVTVSSGPSTVQVPNLASLNRSRASGILDAVGLELGKEDQAPSDTAPEGEIIRQHPIAQTATNPGSSVSITVSSGPEKVTVPNVSGRSIEEAGRVLESAGLVLANSRKEKKSRKPAGTVVATDPSSRSKVALGTSVTMVVSSGQRTSPRILAAPLVATLVAAVVLIGLIVLRNYPLKVGIAFGKIPA